MTDLSDIYQTKWPAAPTYAEPVSDAPLGDIFTAAERAQRLGGNIVSEAAAREESYDRRIEAIRQVTGVTLENPERLGYAQEARGHLREDMRNGDLSPIDESAGVAPYRRRVFDQKVAELQAKHPELEFGGIDEEARALGAEAQQNLARATDQPVNPILKFGAELAGGLWGSRRDPLFLGSLFAGPSTAVGRTALARIATSALGQGFYNAGLAALEQPAVQDWHAKIGMETGIKPAVQDVGMAFLMGMIPGAGIEAVKELAMPLRRLLRGQPEPGDIKTATEALAPQPLPERAMRAGEDSLSADSVLAEKPPDVPPEMHNDLVAAALKRADDQEAPSPEAVAATSGPETAAPELQARIEQANPRNPREAMAAADQALDDFGRRDGMAELAERMRVAREAQDEVTEAWRSDETREKPGDEDISSMVPMKDRNGNTVMRSERAVLSDGDIEEIHADLIRSCQNG